MNYDLPKLPQRAQYFTERPFTRIVEEDCVGNDVSAGQLPDPPDLGGYPFMTVSGTSAVASGTSLSTVRSYQITFMPRDGVIPSYVLQQHQIARNLEQIINPTKNSG